MTFDPIQQKILWHPHSYCTHMKVQSYITIALNQAPSPQYFDIIILLFNILERNTR